MTRCNVGDGWDGRAEEDEMGWGMIWMLIVSATKHRGCYQLFGLPHRWLVKKKWGWINWCLSISSARYQSIYPFQSDAPRCARWVEPGTINLRLSDWFKIRQEKEDLFSDLGMCYRGYLWRADRSFLAKTLGHTMPLGSFQEHGH